MKIHVNKFIYLSLMILGGLSVVMGQSDTARRGVPVAEASPSKRATATRPSSAQDEAKRLANLSPSNTANNSDDYVIGPEDILSVVVWKEKELSATVPVRSDGKISIPLVNDIQASGLTTLQLRQSITTRLSQFLDAPEVTVMVTEVRSKRVSIMGEVEKPGMYPIHGPKSLLQLISEAGGFRPFAARKKITVIRNAANSSTRFLVNYKDLINGSNKSDLQLKPGDIVVVP